VADYLRRFEKAGLTWPEAAALDQGAMERALFPPPIHIPEANRPLPDWSIIQLELKRNCSVTLFLLWQEYREQHPKLGYQYSRFCDRYRHWQGKVDVVMRQEHRAGEKLFVDYAGQTVDIIDRQTGEVRTAQIFVAVMGASSYTYAEATWSQSLSDWIGSHVRALDYINGVPEIVVPDNLRSAVANAHRYEPDLNPTYQDLGQHYGMAIVPARVRKPRDKAKAEAGVLLVERWILAVLRNEIFFSLASLNRHIQQLLERLNERPFKKRDGSRRSLFEAIDRSALRPLPGNAYEFAEWRKVRVAPNIHVEVEGSYYSAPYTLAGKSLDARVTERCVELLHRGERVASHLRGFTRGQYHTIPEHMPKAHQQHLDWTPERMVRWAEQTGEATAAMVHQMLHGRHHPQQAYNACFGLMRLGESYSDDRLEAACRRALATGAVGYRHIESILKHGLDQRPLPAESEAALPLPEHDNLRGPGYYH
jgi:transposase